MATPQFQQLFNFRDLGGHATRDGRRVRTGLLFRSAALSDATDTDLEALAQALRIGTLIDLRTSRETAQARSLAAWPGRLLQLELYEQAGPWAPAATLGPGYVAMLQQPAIGARLVELLDLIAANDTLPAVFFCSMGKDRTGLVAAALLGSLGVSSTAIANDYVRTTAALDALFAFRSRQPGSRVADQLRSIPNLMGAPRDAIETVLDFVQSEHGSMRNYLQAQGATPTLFQTLEERLLE